MTAKKFYAVLGLDEKAGPEELRRAWLRLAVKYHPDRNPGDARAEERFKEIGQAYALLSDPAALARYERTRRPAGAAPRAAEPKPRPQPRTAGPEAGASQAERPEAAAKPGPKPGPGPEPKAEPKARGSEDHADWTDILNSYFQTPRGRDTLRELEEELRKVGYKFSSGGLARWLRGRRKWEGFQRLLAWLPSFRAASYDIDYSLAVSIQAAAAGATVEITHPRDGRPQALQVNLPAGIKNGARFRLPDQGRPRPDGGRGDMLLTVLICS